MSARFLTASWAMSVLILTSVASALADTDAEVLARKNALGVAGAFSNDGFKIRDGHWCGTVTKDKPQFIQVNLYAGNEYWFSAAAVPAARKISVSVFDENGKPLAFEPWSEGATAAAGFSPDASGPYYLKIEGADADAATFCLLYSYK
jgi:hypothetical protein